MVKTSIIIPVYNTALYIEECLDSVFRQTQKEIEVIVIDDGSTDDSWEILKKMQEKYPGLILVRQTHQCQGAARNKGMEMARGEYIYFLDSDDYILRDTLETCYKCATGNGLDIVLFDAFSFEDTSERAPVEPNEYDRHELVNDKIVYSGIGFMEKYQEAPFVPSPCLIYCSARFLREHKVKFLEKIYYEDNEYYCKVMVLADRIMYIPKMFYQRRCRSGSTTGGKFRLEKARDYIEMVCAMADLHTLRDGEGWPVIKKTGMDLLMHLAYLCGKNGLYGEEVLLSKRILDTELKFLDNSIEGIKELKDMCHMKTLCGYFPSGDLCGEKRRINVRYRQLLTQVFQILPLKDTGCKVAIYGCGDYTEKLLDLYREYVGDICAELIFLDSYVESNTFTYKGFPVYNVKTLKEEKLDYILVSSPRYEKEMREMVYGLCKDKVPILLLYGKLGICV